MIPALEIPPAPPELELPPEPPRPGMNSMPEAWNTWAVWARLKDAQVNRAAEWARAVLCATAHAVYQRMREAHLWLDKLHQTGAKP